ncbi:MAG: glycosyltransferase family 2 protein [Steroidobacteraceae bacterium]|nr:glycosyltransferase family 2 protein [Steroidobacteraceae bacterium]
MSVTRPCAVVPVYNHEHAIGAVVAGLRAAGLDCLLVDDGSSAACAAALDRLADADQAVRVLRLPVNQGKGAAVAAGLEAALLDGYTHALQIDADGQHDVTDVPRFLRESAAHPGALIAGRPVFDASMPRARFYGRYASHVMVWLNTLSFDIPDSMCGFRVYPLAPVVDVIREERPGSRMDFDLELLVRLHWRGVPMRWLDASVRYPTDGISHFRPLDDNLRISWMHTRLVFGMLRRLPRLLRGKFA